MYLEILLLSHLLQQPAHGYELRRRIESTTAFAIHNNSLYPALRRFDEAGAVRKTPEYSEGRPPRHVYELTDVGREMLHDMVCELPAELAGSEYEFLARLGMFGLLTSEERRSVLAARDEAVRRHIDHLTGLAERSADLPWGALAVRELTNQAERERAWLAELAEQVDASDPSAGQQAT